jgi:hypothetical protein
MKAKLIKKDDIFYLYVDESWAIASTDSRDNRDKKLSKQNCDSLFGVVDVEKLADNSFDKKFCKDSMQIGLYDVGFEDGFNKAMELNKDKLFTVEDLDNFRKFQIQEQNFSKSCLDVWLKLLQKPTEIDVEIVMESKNKGFTPSRAVEEIQVPKLDSEGNLILKKI